MTNNILKDPRWRDLGLTESEVKSILFICKKFVNGRDSLDDITQTAIIAIITVLGKYKEKEKIIRNRRNFLVSVVKCKLIQEYIKGNRRDLIYNTTDIDDTNDTKEFKVVLGNNAEYSKFEFDLNLIIDNTIECNKDKYIAYAYLYLGMTQSEIAKNMGIHQTLVCDRLKHINSLLRLEYEELNQEDLPDD